MKCTIVILGQRFLRLGDSGSGEPLVYFELIVLRASGSILMEFLHLVWVSDIISTERGQNFLRTPLAKVKNLLVDLLQLYSFSIVELVTCELLGLPTIGKGLPSCHLVS